MHASSKKNFTVVLFLAIFMPGLICRGGDDKTTNKVAMAVVVDKTHHFQVEVPAAWKSGSPTPGTILARVGEAGALMNLAYSEGFDAIDLDDLLAAVKAKNLKMVPGSKVISEGKPTLGGKPARQVAILVPIAGDISLHVIQVFTFSKGNLYLLTIKTHESAFEATRPMIDAMIASFKFLDE